MPKNSKPNGFMVFTFDWKAKHGRNMNLAQATTSAGAIWQKMTAQERSPYNERAKKDKLAGKGKGEKLTCTGTPLAVVQKHKDDLIKRELKMKRDTEAIVRNCAKSDTLETQRFFFISFNYFSKSTKTVVYVPAEVSLAEFTLEDGVLSAYHSYVNPGVNIYGYQFEAEHHSKTTHMLPLPPNAMGETNLGAIYNNVLNFIQDKTTGEYPPVYTINESMPIVESALDYLKSDISARNVPIAVHSMNYLFFILKEATATKGEVEKPKNIFLTDSYIARDPYEYHPKLACTFHEDADKSKYCTQSNVIRWGYMFADFMCNDLAIKPIPGRHMPADMRNSISVITPIPKRSESVYTGISMRSSSSCVTKPVSEDKRFLDKSSIASTSAIRSKHSGVRDCDGSSNNSYFADSSFACVEDDDNENPWQSTSRVKAEEPDITDFDLDQDDDKDNFMLVTKRNSKKRVDNSGHSSFGHGRGYLP